MYSSPWAHGQRMRSFVFIPIQYGPPPNLTRKSSAMYRIIAVLMLLAIALPARTQEPKKATGTKPTQADVAYGKHEAQKLDFYKAESKEPTPLLFFIHGGGWVAGTKSGVPEV